MRPIREGTTNNAGKFRKSPIPPAGFIPPPWGRERAEFFQALRIPMQNGTGDPAKAQLPKVR